VFGLIILESMGVKNVEDFGDSLLIVQQVFENIKFYMDH
jgi:hypothetical protein